MLDIIRDIDSLSNFKRNTSKFVKQMRKSGTPVILTVNGKAKVVVQDAESYQSLLELAPNGFSLDSDNFALLHKPEAQARGIGIPRLRVGI